MRKAGSVKAFSAFFMCPVSHTFPACNGNEMPPWYTKVPVVYKPRCFPLFFLCPVLCGCVGVEGAFALGGVPSCPREEKRLPRPLPARGARLQTDAEPGYFPPQTLRLSAGRSNHSGLFRWKNLAQIRNRLLCFPPAAPPRCPAQSTRKTTRYPGRPPSPALPPASTPQRAFPGEAARPGLPPGARLRR